MNILLIEDDTIEVMKLQRTLAKLQMKHNLIEARNGEEAFEKLNTSAVLPDIILLDLNMPRMSGIEFLGILKSHDTFKYLPTIVLTTSHNRTDLLECYKIGIAGYVIKPLKYDDYQYKLQRVLEYWSVNELVKG